MIIRNSNEAKSAFAMFVADIVINSANRSSHILREDSDLRYCIDDPIHRNEIMRALSTLSDEVLGRMCVLICYETIFSMMISMEQQIFEIYGGFELDLISSVNSRDFPIDMSNIMSSINESMIAKGVWPPQAEI